MRIISGYLKGRRFYPPLKKWPTRPTTDFAKEGLFNILTNYVEFTKIKALDLYGGTGNHSLELISRGCSDVTFVDSFKKCVEFITGISNELKIEDKITIIKSEAFNYLNNCEEQYDYIFADPPYNNQNLTDILQLIFNRKLLCPDGEFILEHRKGIDFSDQPKFQMQRSYGDCSFSFFRNQV